MGHAVGLAVNCCVAVRVLMVLMLLQGGLAAHVQDAHSPDRGLGQLVAGQWRCVVEDLVSGRGLARVLMAATGASTAMTTTMTTPPCYPDVTVHAYSGWPPRRKVLDPRGAVGAMRAMRRPAGWLRWSGWDPRRRTVLLVHGFNGGLDKAPLATLRDAYLEQGGVNVLSLDWSPLSRYPCYADAVRQTRTAARCGAQVLLALQSTLALATGSSVPPPADARFTTCVGHSLGAHICGMLSRAMPHRLLKVVALDPARPQVARLLGDDVLSASAARVVQSFHSNMGFYGDFPAPGDLAGHASHAGFCLNGGRLQPHCDQGGRFARMRCSHFVAVCLYAQLVRDMGRPGAWTTAVACDAACHRPRGHAPLAVKLTEASIDRWRGTYCMDLSLDRACRIDV